MSKHFLAILLFLFNTASVFPQSFLDTVKNTFNRDQRFMQEKLYLHTDKDVYFTGETIWFKLYYVDATFHQPMDVSKVAYVEIISADHKPVMQIKIELNKGMGEGFIDLPSSIGSGNYQLRAYTNWMKNFSADFFFEKKISVMNAYKNSSGNVNYTSKNHIQFFPEGGHLVNGIESKIAFEAVGISGKRDDVAGVIVNSDNDTITHFATLRFGLGQFLLTPHSGKNYKAVCFWNDGTTTVQPLPNASDDGYVMRMKDDGSQLNLLVTTHGTMNNSIVYLLVHTRQRLKVAKLDALQNGRVNFTINKDSLAEGISHITLFNSNRQPVCERLFFKRPVDTVAFQVKSRETSYGTREKISLSIATFNSKSEAVKSNASLSVFLLDSVQQLDQAGITAYLYLTSDIKGNIDSPNYYLYSKNEEVNEATENLMLTHGWTRFDWSNLLNHAPAFNFLPEFSGHIVNARISNREKSSSLKDVPVYFSVPAERYLFSTATSDENGRVRFDVRKFYGAAEVVVQTNHELDSSYRVDVASPFVENYSDRSLSFLNPNPRFASDLSSQFKVTEISRVYGEDHPLDYVLPLSDSTAFYGEPNGKYFLDEYTRFTTMEEVLREYVTEVQVRKSRENFHLHILNTPYNTYFENNPLVLLDGVPVFDMNKIIAFDPLRIKKLEVMSRKVYQGDTSYSGILSFSTYQGDIGGYTLDPNALVVRYDGLQIDKEFYSPNYEDPRNKKSRLPDFRTTLFWSPNISISTQSNSSVPFFSSDLPGKYLVVVEGMTPDGKCGSGRLVIDVHK